MKLFAMFSILLTMLVLGFIVIMLAIAGFCYFMKRIERKKGLSPKMAKWIYILDWTKEDDKNE